MSDRQGDFISDMYVKCPNCRDPHGVWTVRIRTWKDMKNSMRMRCLTCSNVITFRVGSGHQ